MLSRVADSIYWMARYMERAENLSRLLLANQNLLLDAGAEVGTESDFWQPILMTTGDEAGYQAVFDTITGAQVAEYLSARPENGNSIVNCVRTARENARVIRDQLADEVWRAVNDLHLFLSSERAVQMRRQSPAEFLEQVVLGSSLFQGASRSTMMRDEGWQFLQIGTYLERADKTSRLVDTCSAVPLVAPPHPEAQPLRWMSLLRSCSAYHGYREHQTQVDPVSILEFLFLSNTFARSVRFCVREVDTALSKLAAPPGAPDTPDPIRASGRLRADLDFGTIGEILETGIHAYIDQLQSRLNQIGNAIFETFVLYADVTPVASSDLAVHNAGAWHFDLDAQAQQQQQ